MNNKIYMKKGLWALVMAALLFTACSDWTEVEPVKINQSEIDKQNPELYAKYLESLRAYKASDHKVTIAWFNNVNPVPMSRADHTEVLPDSIDIVAIQYPANVDQVFADEMAKVRHEKGTRFVLNMNFESIKRIYDVRLEESSENAVPSENGETEVEAPASAAFVEFLADTVSSMLPMVEKYGYDGVSVGYLGKSILHMTEEERQLHIDYEKAFIGIVEDWHARNGDKILLFEGNPQNLIDKSVLEKCRYIVVPCMDAKDGAKITYNIQSAMVEGVPVDRFVVAVETVSLDKEDVKTGYWADGSRAIAGASQWAASTHDGYTIAGLGIKSVNNDYFNVARIYPYTRDAIATMNPSPKK